MKSNTCFEDALRFDNLADTYDAIRPKYPEAVFCDIVRIAGLTAKNRVLDIGAGSGQFSVPLAERGFTVVALEPGANLASILRSKLIHSVSSSVYEGTFESFKSDVLMDCIVSANAFHWIPASTGYKKSHDLLKQDGTLALFWSFPEATKESESALYSIMNPLPAALQMFCEKNTGQAAMQGSHDEMLESGYFEKIENLEYSWSHSYNPADFFRFLTTYPNYEKLDDQEKREIFRRIETIINKNLDRSITLTHQGFLRIARRLK